ncbi:hypothetical protein Fmac_024816 [Flemingia macrophylla]|uniref:Uncharacterized protein n=1 Tax=Flemingia macrophylla TaxID=520843 RepID=A0ABD1LR25_9FABA
MKAIEEMKSKLDGVESKLNEKEKKKLAQIGRICEERNRTIGKVNELQALINFYKQKAKEPQTNCDNMSHAIHQQIEAMACHVGEAEDEWNKHIDPPLGFFRLFRYCQNLLRSIA